MRAEQTRAGGKFIAIERGLIERWPVRVRSEKPLEWSLHLTATAHRLPNDTPSILPANCSIRVQQQVLNVTGSE